ncbi:MULTISPECIES: TAXI family TRAP transporter solute-binding subunit [unclassified Oleiphilus]|uniref:TAXI family TRAP transporter solute-binding subunit n=1 Tax=unclassified Oleiphilus TaxID=2631174 RepID=UPI0007C3F0AB|nr:MULTISPECIES: TAXI family TRAP transporter solute-binding subunit [unclassified Oleiphilus]KZY71362.1 hypothetical protein A3739_05250 [Oleiphilus sp. HI0067]KZZ57096.1 hypothetical protein A3762_10600 [Oleiphilus sp. HI0125]MCH2158320.1 TAXI family TRAP transporter solute-binding subunit [Oleiphilaceae bacterium]
MIKRAFPLFLLFVSSLLSAEEAHLVMATGGVTGVYYPAGGAICQMLNTQKQNKGVRCFVESSEGSLENLKRLRSGDIDLAIVQSDWMMHDWSGAEEFKFYGPHTGLRHVIKLYDEPFTIVARADSNIRKLEDLKGKRVNIGSEGSGQRATMEWLMKSLAWWHSDFSEVHFVGADEQATALCQDKFDAMVYIAGTPNSSVKSATTDCDSVLVPVRSKKLDRAIAQSEIYAPAEIPRGSYRGMDEDVKTFGVSAHLVSAERVDAGLVQALVTSITRDLNGFKRLHPALKNVGRAQMFSDDVGLPPHQGVKAIKKEFLELSVSE